MYRSCEVATVVVFFLIPCADEYGGIQEGSCCLITLFLLTMFKMKPSVVFSTAMKLEHVILSLVVYCSISPHSVKYPKVR